MGETIKTVINKGLPDISPSDQELSEWAEWVATRPENIQKLCEQLPPWYYYHMPETKQIVEIEAYADDGTMRVTVVGDQISIPTIVPFGVFGIHPNDLVRLEPEDIKR